MLNPLRLRGPVSSVTPDGAVSADIEDNGQPVPLHPQEAQHVAGAVEKRRRDFALGRDCARYALHTLGVADCAIPQGESGRPVWPEGIVGSITHTNGYAAALAAGEKQFLCVGVDAERTGRVTDQLFRMLFGPREKAWLESFATERRSVLATILFSAKEAYYKAWNTGTGKPLGFLDLRIELDDESFIATQPGAPANDWEGHVQGRFVVCGDLVVTSVCVPRF